MLANFFVFFSVILICFQPHAQPSYVCFSLVLLPGEQGSVLVAPLPPSTHVVVCDVVISINRFCIYMKSLQATGAKILAAKAFWFLLIVRVVLTNHVQVGFD